jgi:hypothetical protein
MKGYMWFILLSFLLVVVGWFVFALWFAWQAKYDYLSIVPNADYWGQISSAGFGLLSSALFFVALLMQAEELKGLAREQEASRKQSQAQLEQLRAQTTAALQQAAMSERAQRMSDLLTLVNARSRLESELERWKRENAVHSGDEVPIEAWAKGSADGIREREQRISDINGMARDILATQVFSDKERSTLTLALGIGSGAV